MTLEAAPPALVLVYDGDCPLCERASAAIVRSAGLAEGARRSHLAFEGELPARLEAAGIRNEMAVLDPRTGEIRSGLIGILWFLRATRWGWAARIVDRPWIRAPLTVAYRLVAYNRRVIAPPVPRAYACACDPDPRLAYNLGFTAIVGGAASGAGAAAAIWLAAAAGHGTQGVAGAGLAGASAPLLAMALAAACAPAGRLAAAGHAGWVTAVLALPLAAVGAVWLPLSWLGMTVPAAVRTGLCVAAGLAGGLAAVLSLRRRLPALRRLASPG